MLYWDQTTEPRVSGRRKERINHMKSMAAGGAGMKPKWKRFLAGTLGFLALLAIAFLVMICTEPYSLPYVEESKAFVIRDEKLGKKRIVEDFAATEDYIFLNCDDFVRAFDWNGSYCFSIRFSKNSHNGTADIICVGDLLYIITPSLTTYVYQGDRLKETIVFSTYEERSEFYDRLKPLRNQQILSDGKHLLDKNGQEVMEVSVRRKWATPAESVLIPGAFAAVAICFVVVIVRLGRGSKGLRT